MKKIVLLTSVTEQYGVYLQILLKKICCTCFQTLHSMFNTKQIDHLYQDLHQIIQDIRFYEIYNLITMNHVQVRFDTLEYTANSNGIGEL